MARGKRRHSRVRFFLTLLAVGFGLLVVQHVGYRLIVGEVEQRGDAAFYAVPADLPPGEPGQLIRSEPILSAPFGTDAWRVLYHSRDLAGRDIAVSGTVIAPEGGGATLDTAASSGRTVVAWAHPTTGAATQCAPSLGVDPFLGMEGVHELLDAGYVVAATDYPGMGVDGRSAYLLGVPESNAVLDSVRAARQLPTEAGGHVLLWGHSQGGQAALFAAQRAKEYAPDLEIGGIAVAAPAADLTALMKDDIVDLSGVTIASFAIDAYTDAYRDRFGSDAILGILTPEGRAATPDMAALCLLTQAKEIHAIADPLVGKYVVSDPATTEPWQTMLTENSAGASPLGIPVLIAQGLADTLVLPAATQSYVSRLCAAGEHVNLVEFDGVTHADVAYAALPDVLDFFARVNRGEPTVSTC